MSAWPALWGAEIASLGAIAPAATTWCVVESDGTVTAYTDTTTVITTFPSVAPPLQGSAMIITCLNAGRTGAGSLMFVKTNQARDYNPTNDTGAIPVLSGVPMILPARDLVNIHIRLTTSTDLVYINIFG